MANVTDFLAPLEPNQTSRVFDIDPSVEEALSTFTPYLWNLASANQAGANDVRFQWDEIDYTSNTDAINNYGGYSAVATSLVVDDGTAFTAKDKVKVTRTGEVFQVVSISTNTLTVVRNLGSSAAIILDNDELLILGSAMEVASQSPDENDANTTTVYNYLETYRRSFSFSGTWLRTNGTPGMGYTDKVAFNLREALRDIENTLFFGKRDVDTTTFSKERYATGGLDQYITTNIENVGGTLSETNWNTILTDTIFNYGGDEKIAFCGRNFMRSFLKFATTSYQVGVEADIGTRMGLSVGSYISSTGNVLVLIEHPLFRPSTALSGTMYVVDPADIRTRYSQKTNGTVPTELKYTNGLLQLGQSLEEKDRDGLKTEYFAEYGLELRNEQHHSIVKGVTGPA